VTIADLPDNKPDLSDEVFEDLCWQASELLYSWSGRQFNGGCHSTVVLDTPPGASGSAYCWRDWEDPWVPRGARSVGSRVVASLPDAPVTSIEMVMVDGVELTTAEYIAELPAGLIHRVGGAEWPTGTRVTYSHGLMPPIGGQRAAVLLALELGRSWTGAKCNLPKRIESISREGITINLAVAMQGWRTGIWDIDAWLHSVNPSMMTRRASAWSPDALHTRRTTT
jgi:hypothetical protein